MAILTLLLKKQECGSMAKPTAPPGREGFPHPVHDSGRGALVVGCREKGRGGHFLFNTRHFLCRIQFSLPGEDGNF